MSEFSYMILLAGMLVGCGESEKCDTGEGDNPCPSACDESIEQLAAVYADCGVDFSTSTTATTLGTTDTATTGGTAELECTDEEAAGLACMTDCYEGADCAAIQGSDIPGALELTGCVMGCMGFSTLTTLTGT